MTEILRGWALRGKTVRDRVLASIIVDDSGCWLWQKYRRDDGYGEMGVPGDRARLAHRVAYEEWHGPVPSGFHLDHACHNKSVARGECPGGGSCPHRACVNPGHLKPATPRDNCLGGESFAAKNARRTHCLRGHELSGENLYRGPGGLPRRCRTCDGITRRERARKRGILDAIA